MATRNAVQQIGTNVEIYRDAVDRDLRIKKILKTKEAVLAGYKTIMSYVIFEDILNNNLVKIPFANNNAGIWVILPDDDILQKDTAFINNIKNFNCDALKKYTLNQILSGLRVCFYGDLYTADDDIYVVSKNVRRKQTKSNPNFDAFSLMGDILYNSNYLLNLKRIAGVNLNNMQPCRIILPHEGGSNINYIRIQCGFEPEIYNRKKACSLLTLPRLAEIHNTLFPIEPKKDKQVVHTIDGNFLNSSICNLAVISYSDNKNITSLYLSTTYQIHNIFHTEFEKCNSIKEITDIIYLNNLQIKGSNIYEISNDVYRSIMDDTEYNGLSFTIDDDIELIEERIKKRHKNNYIFCAKNIITGEVEKFNTYRALCYYLVQQTGDKLESITRYCRNLQNTGEIFTIGKTVKYSVWIEEKNILPLFNIGGSKNVKS